MSTAGIFFVSGGFQLWRDFCRTSSDAFVEQSVTLYTAFVAERRKAFDADYSTCNVANRLERSHSGSKTHGQLPRSESGSDVASSSGSLVTVIQKKKVDAGRASSSTVKADKQIGSNGKSSAKGAACSTKGHSKKSAVTGLDVVVTQRKRRSLRKRRKLNLTSCKEVISLLSMI